MLLVDFSRVAAAALSGRQAVKGSSARRSIGLHGVAEFFQDNLSLVCNQKAVTNE
jgi:hypothetical protein